MGFILILFGLYNLGNIQNDLSRGIVMIIGMGIASVLCIHMIGRHFGEFFIKFSVNQLKKDKWFELVKVIILLVVIFEQFVYSGYVEITNTYNRSLVDISESRDIDDNTLQFMSYNAPFTPRCIKQTFNITSEWEQVALLYIEDETKFEEWCVDNYSRINDEAKDAIVGRQLLIYLLLAWVFVDMLRRSRRNIIDFVKNVKIAMNKRRTK